MRAQTRPRGRGDRDFKDGPTCIGESSDISVASHLRSGAVKGRNVSNGRVEDGRGSLGHSATLRFPSPLIEPDVPISGIRLSDWLHREVHGEQTNRTRLRHGE